jgi:hypothetical protein
MSDPPIDLAPSPLWAERLVRFLDDGFQVPGTRFRIGCDGVIGLVAPLAGDMVAAAAALSLFSVALQRGAPRAVLARMAINVALDALIGAIPLLGDAFDFGFKSNRRNLRLLQRVQEQPRARALADYLVIGLFLLAVLALIVLPLVFVMYVLRHAASISCTSWPSDH